MIISGWIAIHFGYSDIFILIFIVSGCVVFHSLPSFQFVLSPMCLLTRTKEMSWNMESGPFSQTLNHSLLIIMFFYDQMYIHMYSRMTTMERLYFSDFVYKEACSVYPRNVIVCCN